MKLAIIGAGNVGGALGTAWAQNAGHDIIFGAALEDFPTWDRALRR